MVHAGTNKRGYVYDSDLRRRYPPSLGTIASAGTFSVLLVLH